MPSAPAQTAPASRRLPGIREVLFATDFSNSADRAAKRVARLPLAPRANVTILHVLPRRLSVASSLVTGLAQEQLAKTHAALRRALRTRGRDDIVTTVHLVRGDPAEQVAKRAADSRVELIVVGRRGAGLVRNLILGSTSRRVVRLASQPVLVVHDAADEPYRNIVVGVNLSRPSVHALHLASRLIDPARTKLTVVTAVDDPLRGLPASLTPNKPLERRQAIRRRLKARVTSIRKLVAPLGLESDRWRLDLEPRDPRTLILAAAKRRHADLIAVGSTSIIGFPRLLLGSVAQAVLDHATCDVLIITRS